MVFGAENPELSRPVVSDEGRAAAILRGRLKELEKRLAFIERW